MSTYAEFKKIATSWGRGRARDDRWRARAAGWATGTCEICVISTQCTYMEDWW